MIDTKKAKVKVLSLAFQGTLVDYPNKEKSNEVLNAIHSKQKGFTSVDAREFLIDAPSYWNWSRLGYITQNHGQKVPETDFCYIDVGTLDNVHHRLPEKENLVNAKDAPSRARKIVHFGDVLYSTVRPYLHNICIVNKDFSRMPIASTAFCVMQAKDSVLLNKYLFYWLLTPEFDKYSNGDPSKGALYPAIGEKDLLHGVIPLPSVDEQRLIVEKIEQVFSVLDTIDELQKKYADNMTTLKSKLIDLAIQGKLTEQLPEDGTAEELYQQIQAEKQALIKAGKIKKEKPLPEINENEIPFEIPNNWKWVRLKEITSNLTLNDGDWVLSDDMVPIGDVKLVQLGSIGDLQYKDKGFKYLTLQRFKELNGKQIFPGYLLINRLVADKMLLCIIPPIDGILMTAVDVCWVAPQEKYYDIKYLMYTLSSSSIQQKVKEVGYGVTRFRISKTNLISIPFPFPPLAEQKRIVVQLEKILKFLEIKEKRL